VASLGTLAVNIGANTRPLQQGLQSALASAKSFASGVMQTFTGMQLSNLFTGAVQQTKQMAIAVVKLAADAEVAQARFSVLLGNVADGAAMFKQLEKFALRTSFSIESASEAATMLLAKGVQQADVIDTMQLLGDLAMGDAERLGLLAKAYTDVQAKGKLMAQEQNQFAENGINLFELLQQTTGKNAGQLMAMREAGQITFSMLQTALKAATSEGGKFFGALAQGNATFTGQFNSLIEGVQTLGRMLGEMVLPRLKEIVTEANKLLQAFLEMPDQAKFLSDVLKASIDVAFAYIEQEWDSLLKRMIVGAGNALADLLNATNPINVAAGMIGEGAGIMANAGQGQSLPAVAEAQERLRKLLDQLRQGAAGVAGAVDPNKVKPMGGPPAKAAEAITMSIADMISNMQANATPIIDSLNTWMGGTLLRAQMALQPLLNGKPTGRSMDPRSEFAGAVQFGTAEASAAIAQAIAQNKEPAVEATEQQTETLMQPLNVMANALKNGFVQKIVGNLLD
jgi:tape measure domain-containing protein